MKEADGWFHFKKNKDSEKLADSRFLQGFCFWVMQPGQEGGVGGRML